MNSLDLGDIYKIYPIDYKLIIPVIADAMDSIPSAFISKSFALSGTF